MIMIANYVVKENAVAVDLLSVILITAHLWSKCKYSFSSPILGQSPFRPFKDANKCFL